MKLDNKIIEILENNGFYINEIEKQDKEFYVEINQTTPCGEDWWETVWFDGTNKGFVDGVKNRYDNFDVYEESEIWIGCRGKNGVPSSIRELVEDAEWKKRELRIIFDQLKELE